MTRLKKLHKDTRSSLNNIEWNAAALCGISGLIAQPELLNKTSIQEIIEIDSFELNFHQATGLSLQNGDRQSRINELISAAKRSLICDSIEIIANYTYRAVRILNTGRDPIEQKDQFSIKLMHLHTKKKNNPSEYFSENDRKFFSELVIPLRHCIRHNNATILYNKSICYKGTHSNYIFEFNQSWKNMSKNNISLTLKQAWEIFIVLKNISDKAFRKILSAEK